jgi:hypothetical protein
MLWDRIKCCVCETTITSQWSEQDWKCSTQEEEILKAFDLHYNSSPLFLCKPTSHLNPSILWVLPPIGFIKLNSTRPPKATLGLLTSTKPSKMTVEMF